MRTGSLIIATASTLIMLPSMFISTACVKKASDQATVEKAQTTVRKEGLSKIVDFEKDFPGFKLAWGPKYYDRETIFDYIDGGADVYLSRGFAEVMNFELGDASNPDTKLNFDLYDMALPENASSIFDKELSGEKIKLADGRECTVGENLIACRVARYYLKISSFSKYPSEEFKELAGKISSKVAER